MYNIQHLMQKELILTLHRLSCEGLLQKKVSQIGVRHFLK